jgi:acyl-CoA dehydrogenase
VFPFGLNQHAPSDHIGTKVARLLMEPSVSRDRLTEYMYKPTAETDPVGVLDHALKAVIATEAAEGKLRKAARSGQVSGWTSHAQLADAQGKGLITQEEFSAITRARQLKRAVIMVDDFDQQLNNPDPEVTTRVVF